MLPQARVHREVGDPASAKPDYARFLELWSNAPTDYPHVPGAREKAGV